MNISFTKFAVIILVIVAVYLIYHFFWTGQSQDNLITRFKTFVFKSEDENEASDSIQPASDPSDAWVK